MEYFQHLITFNYYLKKMTSDYSLLVSLILKIAIYTRRKVLFLSFKILFYPRYQFFSSAPSSFPANYFHENKYFFSWREIFFFMKINSSIRENKSVKTRGYYGRRAVNVVYQSSSTFLSMVNKHQNQCLLIERISEIYCNFAIVSTEERFLLYMKTLSVDLKR